MKQINQLFRRFKRSIGKIGKKTIIFIFVFALVFASATYTYTTLVSSHLKTMTLTLNYEGAKKGLNPSGGRFDIGEIKSDEVLRRAIEILGDDSLTVENVRDRIFIDSKMPYSTLDKTRNAIASGTNYSYVPAEFDIYYSQKEKFAKNNTVAFLNALSEAYSEHFQAEYSDKNTILGVTELEDLSEYDYYEIYFVLTDKVNSMMGYLEKHKADNNTFRSQNTGYTFENLNAMLANVRDVDLVNLEAYVIQNKISRDKSAFLRKQEYNAYNLGLDYDKNMQASDIANNALLIYDPNITGVAFVPSIDNKNQYYMGRTKTGIDNIAMRSFDDGMRAKNIKKDIDSLNNIITKYNGAVASSSYTISEADKMISSICEYIKRISILAIQTDNDYIATKTNDYITYSLPEESGLISVSLFVNNFLKGLIIPAIILIIYKLSKTWLDEKRTYLHKKLKLDEEDTAE